LDFGYCTISVLKKDLRYAYKTGFVSQLNLTPFENKLRKSAYPTSNIWTSTYQDKWSKSNLNTLFKRPNSPLVKSYNEKTLALKILSLDLNTAEKTELSKFGGMTLPAIKKP